MLNRKCLAGSLATFLAIWLVSADPAAAQTHADPVPRKEENFDRGWKFYRGEAVGADQPGFDDASWRALDLPHDWSIEVPADVPQKPGSQEGPFDKNSPARNYGAYLDGGVGWYRKTFTLPASAPGEQCMILFDGAYENADVFLNGQKLGSHPYGFTSFSYDLTPLLKPASEKNVLAVRLQADQPGCRWYSGAGLYRHVHLIVTHSVHVAQWGTYITTPAVTPGSAQVKVNTLLRNDGGAAANATLTTILLDPSGKEVARLQSGQAVAAKASAPVEQTLPVVSPQRWSCETPLLYQAISEVRVGTVLVDSLHTPFGIRTIEFTKDKGFFLNGERVQIKGVCDHHDLGCLGAAAYRRAIQRQIEVLKSFGCNAIRTSHNPPAPELLDLCDQMGMLVMDEAFDEWKENHHTYGYATIFDAWSEPDLVSMLDRDRNHPSIVLYSIGNEIPEGRAGKPEAGPTAARLVAICHREDPTRPVTSACPSPGADWNSGLAQALDVFGLNYNPGWYERNDPASKATPKPGDTGYHGQLPLVGSETCSQVDSRGEYDLKLDEAGNVQIVSKADNQISSYDYWRPGWGCSAETDLLALKDAPWVAGEFVWTGFDYLGEPNPFNWPSRSSYFGIVDLAGFPKDRYYIYKSVWSAEPVAHILPMGWNWPGFEGKTIPVRVFTNADTVELFLNGKSLGSKRFPSESAEQTLEKSGKDKTVSLVKSPGMHLEWAVPYTPGELKAVATKDGKIVKTDVVRTAGAPAKLRLSADRTRIAADGQDLSFVKVEVLDQDGNICPNADNEIHFAVDGNALAIAGLDNGDATNHESFQGRDHQAYHGLALAVLKSNDNVAGDSKLTASGEGLTAASIILSTTAVN